MRLFHAVLPTALITFSIQLSVQNDLTSPFALTFGPSSISSSRYNASGSIEIIRHPVTEEYNEYYKSAIDNFGAKNEDESSATAMFSRAIAPVTEYLTKHTGHKPDYTTLFVPSTFHYITRYAASLALFSEYPDDWPTKMGPSHQAACQGYGFLEGRNLGRPLEDCVDEGPLNLILVLEYEADYLYAWIVEVEFEFGTFPQHFERFSKECGEHAREVSRASYLG